MDDKGYMKAEYSNGGLHLSEAGSAVWHKALRIYAAQKMCPGAELRLIGEGAMGSNDTHN